MVRPCASCHVELCEMASTWLGLHVHLQHPRLRGGTHVAHTLHVASPIAPAARGAPAVGAGLWNELFSSKTITDQMICTQANNVGVCAVRCASSCTEPSVPSITISVHKRSTMRSWTWLLRSQLRRARLHLQRGARHGAALGETAAPCLAPLWVAATLTPTPSCAPGAGRSWIPARRSSTGNRDSPICSWASPPG